MAKSNEQIVRFFETATNEGFLAAFEKCAAPNCVWWAPGMGEIQDRLGTLMAASKKTFEGPVKLEIRGTPISSGDRVTSQAAC